MAEKGIVPVKLSLTEGDFYTCGHQTGAKAAMNGKRFSVRTMTFMYSTPRKSSSSS